ncbi:MAG: AraC family transcriptional regulator [Ruminococcaceae bacterium]|nr:AraC family transcriptional regulator [Oscillospiraceae bacterium]
MFVMSKYYYDFTVSAIDLVAERKCRIGWTKEEPERHCCSLVYILTGNAAFIYPDEKVIYAEKDCILWFPYGDKHTLEAIGEEPLSYICVSFHISPDTILSHFRFDHFVAHNARAYLDFFTNAADAFFKKEPFYMLYLRSMVQLTLYRLLRSRLAKDSSLKSFNKVETARIFIEEYYVEKITVEQLAKTSGLSPSYFRKKFREAFGSSPNQYINEVRCRHAKELLISGVFTMQEIAQKCGFDNAFYFSHVFKKFTGVSPADFKK